MVLTYVRLRCAREAAMARYAAWVGVPEIEPARIVRERDSIDLACTDGEWRGLTVFVYESGPWTVFENYSGGLGLRPVDSWLELAQSDDLVWVDCNDAIAYAELVVVTGGRVIRHFLQDEQDSSQDVNVGTLPEESGLFARRFKDWIRVVGWAEQDSDNLDQPEQGWLWIHKPSWPDN